MFEVWELGEGDAYDEIPSRQMKTLVMASAKRFLSKAILDAPDMICTFGCDATEEELEEHVLVRTGLKTPWIKHTLADFVKQYERKTGITTWEMVPEPGLSIREKEACRAAAVEFVGSKGLVLFRSFGFSFQVVDPEDVLDDEEMARHVEKATGLFTEWYPHRESDDPDPTVGKAGPTVGNASPSVGNAGPTVGNAAPSVGNAAPSVGNAGPAVGKAGPSVGNAGPTVGNAGPTVGNAAPSVGKRGPSVGNAGPSVGKAGPSVGKAGPSVGNAGPAVGKKKRHVCPVCKVEFKNRFAKADHTRRGKCVRTTVG